MEQVGDVVTAVAQRGQHVVLYGERGVGKTSLANVLPDIFRDDDRHLVSARINCTTSDTFADLWRRVFRELGVSNADNRSLSPEDVRFALQTWGRPSLIVIDELDRLEDDEALSLLADTTTTLSDHSTPTTLVLVGVAASIDELIGDHRSVERALVQVQMPRMSASELTEIIDKGCKRLDLLIADAARTRIAQLSEGLPHYAHLLGLHAAQRAIMDDRELIRPGDVATAIDVAVQKAQHSILNAYGVATRSPRKDSLFGQVLLACALARKDELGYFTPGAVRRPMSQIMGRPYEIAAFTRHLNEFSEPGRGEILMKEGQPRKWVYRFANPLVQPFVILNGLANGLVSDDIVRELQTSLGDEPPDEALHGEHPLF